jgi:hypothetical protein
MIYENEIFEFLHGRTAPRRRDFDSFFEVAEVSEGVFSVIWSKHRYPVNKHGASVWSAHRMYKHPFLGQIVAAVSDTDSDITRSKHFTVHLDEKIDSYDKLVDELEAELDRRLREVDDYVPTKQDLTCDAYDKLWHEEDRMAFLMEKVGLAGHMERIRQFKSENGL